MEYNPKIDTYIEKSAPFAKPILEHLRDLVHRACPLVEEKMKWSMPHFDYNGEMMCGMAAFKQHASFGFWKASLMTDPALVETARSEAAMGHLGKIKSMKDLPSDKKLTGYIREAMKLNDDGIKVAAKPKAGKKELVVPDYFLKTLVKNKIADKNFAAFPAGQRKEYVNWIAGAKRDDTRERRIILAIAQIAEGKYKDWKYEKRS